MRTAMADILGIGENATDTLIHLPHFPVSDSALETLSTRVLPGGQVATAMIACQRWGLRTRYVGVVGDDSAAEMHQKVLRRSGVESHLIAVRNCISHQSVILVDGKTGERTVLWKRDPRLRLRSSALRRDWVTSVRLLHIDGHDPEATIIAARWARAAKIPVVADFDHVSPALLRLLPFVDFPVISRGFRRTGAGEQNLLRSLPRLKRKYGFRLICATLGVGGAVAWDGLRFWYAPSYRVRVVDSTGAGDLFHAGFAYGILRGWDWQRVLEFSCAAGGLNCTALGARGGIRSEREVEALRRKGRCNPPVFSSTQLRRAAITALRD